MHYPLFLNLKGKKVAVFGAGKVGTRKVKTLLAAGAKVEVFSREYSGELRRLSKRSPSRLKLKPHATTESLLSNAVLGFAATSDAKFNQRVALLCRKRGLWVNVADDPGQCDFYVPALVKKNGFQIAISTGGKNPRRAKKLRLALSKNL